MRKLLFIFAASILGMVACNDERVEMEVQKEVNGSSIMALPPGWSSYGGQGIFIDYDETTGEFKCLPASAACFVIIKPPTGNIIQGYGGNPDQTFYSGVNITLDPDVTSIEHLDVDVLVHELQDLTEVTIIP